MRYAVDTNVAIIANGRPDTSNGGRQPSITARKCAADFLARLLQGGTILVDFNGDIQAEYRRYLNAAGQPGVGDRFYRQVLMSAPQRIERVELPKNADGSYADFPDDPRLAAFDPSDRKFAALSRREEVPVANATDTDWLHHRQPLEENGVAIDFLCGTDPQRWFSP